MSVRLNPFTLLLKNVYALSSIVVTGGTTMNFFFKFL